MAKEGIKNVVIVGAGTIGSYIAEMLQREAFDVFLIDKDRQALEEAGEALDIQMLHGNGANPELLERAGLAEHPLVLAFTDSCEINLLVGSIAKSMGAWKVIARVRSAWCVDSSRINLRKALDIDLLLNPELLTAIEIVKFLDNPDALALIHYAHGKVQLRQFLLDAKSKFCDRSLKDCQIPQDVLVVVRSRDEEVIIPGGNDVVRAGDKLTIIGLPNRLAEVQKLFHAPSPPPKNIVIAGGGNSGYFLARSLEHRNFNVKLIEPDTECCENLSERLSNTTIINGNFTRVGFLKEERVDKADVFIAVTGDDEDNLMACLLAKEIGVKQTIANIDRPDYTTLVQKVGVDLALSPRHVMADRVMALVMGGRIQAVSLMEQGQVEVIEFLAESGNAIVGQPLKKIVLPEGSIISSIVRHGHAKIPHGEDKIRPGDRVVITALRDAMSEVEKLFEKR